jgi:hypothetical protein
MDIANVDKVKLLHALWNTSKPASFFATSGMPAPAFDSDEASVAVKDYIDYFQGRCIKMDLRGDTADPSLFDRDFGAGAAQRAVAVAKQ